MPRDIEEFLKMAAQRRQQQKQKAAGQRPAAAPKKPPVQPRNPSARLPLPPANQPSRPLRPGEEIRILGGAAEPTDMRDQSVSEHVRVHIDTSSLGEHARHLGEQVGLADDKMDARLHRKFDHSVASLKPAGTAHHETTSVTERDVSQLASELLDMLRSPKSIRQAILIAEVLKRPEFD